MPEFDPIHLLSIRLIGGLAAGITLSFIIVYLYGPERSAYLTKKYILPIGILIVILIIITKIVYLFVTGEELPFL